MIECDIFSIDENLKLIVTTYSYDKVIDEDEYDQIFDYIENLKYSTPFDRIRKEPYDYSDWDEYAKKGIIAYDNFTDKNILTSMPVYPLDITDIPTNILKMLEKY
jgi:hypothetical protein